MSRENELFHQRESLNYAYKAKVHEIKSRKGADKEMVYPNQVAAATEVVHELYGKDKVAVTLIAQPQVGKTGTFMEVAYKACTHPDDNCIVDPRKVFIITGMSDNDWQKQTKDDMLEAFKSRVYHRGRLNTTDRADGFYTNLTHATNALIILDECHIGVEKEHQVSRMLRRLGLLDIAMLREKNIKILEVSATPGATLYDTEKWGDDNHSIVMLNPSTKYFGFRNFLEEGRIHPSFDLAKDEELEKLVTFIKETFPTPRWHIIRLPAKSRKNGAFEQKLHQICAREKWETIRHSAGSDRFADIDHHLDTQPKGHRIILIKEFWRAGKRLIDTYMGIVHEPLTATMDTNVTAQGLPGRLCGNDKQAGPGSPHMFCDVERIEEYMAWIDARGDWTKVKEYNSRCLTIKKGRVTSSKATFAHHSNVAGITGIVDSPSTSSVESPTEPRTIPRNFTISETDYKLIKKIGGKWDETTVMKVLKKHNPELVEELERMTITHITQPDKSYEKIKELEQAVASHTLLSIVEADTKYIDTCQIWLDSKKHRLFVLRHYGSREKR